MEESTVCIWQFVLFSVVGQLDIVCMGRCPHRLAVGTEEVHVVDALTHLVAVNGPNPGSLQRRIGGQ